MRKLNFVKNVSCFLGVWLSCLTVQCLAQLPSGVYVGQFTCNRCTSNIVLEIQQLAHDRYTGFIWFDDIECNVSGESAGIEFTGTKSNANENEILINHKNTLTIAGRGVRGDKFYPGIRNAARLHSYFTFTNALIAHNRSNSWSRVTLAQNEILLSTRQCTDTRLTLDEKRTKEWRNALEVQYNDIESTSVTFLKAKSEKDKVYSLLKWADLFYAEFPEYSSYSTPTEFLFQDKYFIPFFGKSVREVTNDDIEDVNNSIRDLRSLRKEEYSYLLKDHTTILQNFLNQSNLNRNLDKLDTWERTHNSALVSVKAALARTEISKLKSELSDIKKSRSLLPSEVNGYSKEITSKISELSRSELDQKLDKLIAADATLSNLRELKGFYANNSQLRSDLTDSAKDEIHSKLISTIDSKEAVLTQTKRSEFDKLTMTMKALPDINSWLTTYKSDYVPFGGPLATAYESMAEKRNSLIIANYQAIESALGQLTYTDEIEEFISRHGLLNTGNPDISRRIVQIQDKRNRDLRSAMKSTTTGRWYANFAEAKGISIGEFVNRIPAFSVEAGDYLTTITEALQKAGKRIDPTSPYTLKVNIVDKYLVYTRSSNSQAVEKRDVLGYALDIRIECNMDVYRKGYIFQTNATLLSDALYVILPSDNITTLVESQIRTLEKAVTGLFNNLDYSIRTTSDTTWQNELEHELTSADKYFAVYEKAKALSDNHINVDAISEIQAIHDENRMVTGVREAEYLRNNPMMQVFDDFFARGMLSGSEWRPQQTWKQILSETGISIANIHRDKSDLPYVSQIISGQAIDLGGDNLPDAHGIISKSSLIEKNCLARINGVLYRVPAATIHYIDFEEGADNLQGKINTLTTNAASQLAHTLRPFIEASSSDEPVEYAPRPEMFSFGTNSYLNTNIDIDKKDKIEINVSGTVTYGLMAGSGGPDGIGGFTAYNEVSDFRHGALLMRIGSGEWMSVGNKKSIVATTSGKLIFMVNDREPMNNQGRFNIQVNLFKPVK